MGKLTDRVWLVGSGHRDVIDSMAACCVRAGIERCARSSWQPDTVSMHAGHQMVVAFDPVIEELSEGMLWILINGKVCHALAVRT